MTNEDFRRLALALPVAGRKPFSQNADEGTIKSALQTAWRNVAPKSLQF